VQHGNSDEQQRAPSKPTPAHEPKKVRSVAAAAKARHASVDVAAQPVVGKRKRKPIHFSSPEPEVRTVPG